MLQQLFLDFYHLDHLPQLSLEEILILVLGHCLSVKSNLRFYIFLIGLSFHLLIALLLFLFTFSYSFWLSSLLLLHSWHDFLYFSLFWLAESFGFILKLNLRCKKQLFWVIFNGLTLWFQRRKWFDFLSFIHVLMISLYLRRVTALIWRGLKFLLGLNLCRSRYLKLRIV